ncbi:MAG: trypsin-like peptidase domain-containing protein [Gemmatimonadota bacterium]|nr:MAG: trypsin-like peptidase domain-containing protein [Gemmatimonadota bacterium]
MSDPLRKKLKAFIYTSLALVLALGLASGLRWARGGEAAPVETVRVAAPVAAVGTQPTTNRQPAAEPVGNELDSVQADFRALADMSLALRSIAQSVTPAVVAVSTRGTPRMPSRLEEFFGPWHPPSEDTPFNMPLGRGSGFVVSPDGYVITNNHVVAYAEEIEVTLPDGRGFAAELIGRDPTTDIALLKINGKDLPSVKLGNPDALEVGDFVLAIGNPGTLGSDLPFTVTAGIVSAMGRNLEIIRRSAGEGADYAIEDFIQTDAVINPGNSGGPLVNYRGEVIGVNTAIQSTTGFYQGYGFAIPISLARDVMEDLIEYGRVRRAALRVFIQGVSPADARAFGLAEPKGAVVQGFPDDSPAQKAGIERGDVIVAVNDKPVDRVGQLQRTIASYEPGDRVQIKIVRYGEERTVTVKLTEADVPQPEPTREPAAYRPVNALLGVNVIDLDSAEARRLNFEVSGDIKGVLVTRVARFGPAEAAGLVAGWIIQSVNRKPVGNLDEFERAMEGIKPGDVVSIDAVALNEEGEPTYRIFNLEAAQN